MLARNNSDRQSELSLKRTQPESYLSSGGRKQPIILLIARQHSQAEFSTFFDLVYGTKNAC